MSYDREHMRQLFREDDRLRAEREEEARQSAAPPPTRTVHKDFTSINVLAPAARATEEKDWSGWQRWLDGNIKAATTQLTDEMLDTMAAAIAALRRERENEINRRAAPLETESRELKNALTAAADRVAAVEKAHAELRDRRTRDEVQARYSDHVVEIRKQLASTHVELANKHIEAALAERDARIKQLETKMAMLVQFLGMSGDYKLPQGL
jgi:hypothetical protein